MRWPGKEGADLFPAEKVAEFRGGIGGGGEGLVETVHVEQDLALRGLREAALDLALEPALGLKVIRELPAVPQDPAVRAPGDLVGLLGKGTELPYLAQLQIDLAGALGQLALLAQGLPVQPWSHPNLGGAEDDAPGPLLAVGQGALGLGR